MRILLIDTDLKYVRLAQQWLVKINLQAEVAISYQEAEEKFSTDSFDVIYLGIDSFSHDRNGFNMLFRSLNKYKFMYQIAMNGNVGSSSMMELESGADIVVRGQPEEEELLYLVENGIRSIQQRRSIFLDERTSLFNRYCFNEQLQREQTSFGRYLGDCSLVILKVEHYPAVVAEGGQFAADELMRLYAQKLQQTLRKADSAGHWVEDEFVVLLSNTKLDAAVLTIEKLQASLLSMEDQVSGQRGISAGAASFQVNGLQLYASANSALSVATEQGSNQIVRAEAASAKEAL